nr:MAG TPA: hypothetical protein [Caudoviricetes sp.]DAM25497.1 MAG TPA: hypothetical protein [Caudoviricetes sp.]DAT94108.1 MAG TPA: hypothetical protein [Caudoviricetes sp.]
MPRPVLQTGQGGGTNLRLRYVSCGYFSTGERKRQWRRNEKSNTG